MDITIFFILGFEKKHSPPEIASCEDNCEDFVLNMYKPSCVHKTSRKHECNSISGYMQKAKKLQGI